MKQTKYSKLSIEELEDMKAKIDHEIVSKTADMIQIKSNFNKLNTKFNKMKYQEIPLLKEEMKEVQEEINRKTNK